MLLLLVMTVNKQTKAHLIRLIPGLEQEKEREEEGDGDNSEHGRDSE